MEPPHVTRNTRHGARTLRALATTLRTVRGVQEPDAWLRLAGAAARQKSAPARMVLFHGLPDLLLGARPEVLCHG